VPQIEPRGGNVITLKPCVVNLGDRVSVEPRRAQPRGTLPYTLSTLKKIFGTVKRRPARRSVSPDLGSEDPDWRPAGKSIRSTKGARKLAHGVSNRAQVPEFGYILLSMPAALLLTAFNVSDYLSFLGPHSIASCSRRDFCLHCQKTSSQA
jgi:hypothetical protein